MNYVNRRRRTQLLYTRSCMLHRQRLSRLPPPPSISRQIGAKKKPPKNLRKKKYASSARAQSPNRCSSEQNSDKCFFLKYSFLFFNKKKGSARFVCVSRSSAEGRATHFSADRSRGSLNRHSHLACGCGIYMYI